MCRSCPGTMCTCADQGKQNNAQRVSGTKCSSKEPRRSAGYRAVWHSTCKTRGRCLGLSTLGETKEPQALQQGASVRHPKLEVQALTSRIGAPAILCGSPMHARFRESAICIDPNKWERAAEFTYRLWQPTVSIRTPTKPTSPPATPPLPMPRPPNRFTTHPLTQLSREEGPCPPVRLQMDCWKRKNQQRTRQLTMKLGHEKQNVVAESVQLIAPCPQSTANGGLSNMVQGTRTHMEHTGWRHQHQRQDTHTLSVDDPTHE